MNEHARFPNGRLEAVPDCPCDHCRAVFEEWAEAARGFQAWFDALPALQLRSYFGLVRVVSPVQRGEQ